MDRSTFPQQAAQQGSELSGMSACPDMLDMDRFETCPMTSEDMSMSTCPSVSDGQVHLSMSVSAGVGGHVGHAVLPVHLIRAHKRTASD